jgi:tetratricopeptide (TPR) repeat protein
MKKLILIISAIALIGCATPVRQVREPSSSLIPPMSEKGTNIAVIHLYALDDYMRRLMKAQGKEVPINPDLSEWTLPTGMVQPQPLPAVQSVRHQKEIDTSRRLYEEGKYVEAAKAVQAALKDEPDNEFILECYARALYRTDTYRPASYEFYRRLISLLDSKANEKTTIPLDSWFMEAYWKYGTLLMDMGDWERAAFEISRALAISIIHNDVQGFVPQAYSYLTKAYFHLTRYDVAKYYAEAALQIDPNNEYVKYYLDEIKVEHP